MSNNINAYYATIGNLTSTTGKIANFSTGNFLCTGTFNLNQGLIFANTGNKLGISKTNPVYTLDVGGDINYTGKLYNNGNLVTTETSASSFWSKSGLYLNYNNNVIIGTNTQTPYILYVLGNSYFNGNLETSSNITCQNLNCTNQITSLNNVLTNLTVQSSCLLNCDLNMGLNDINSATLISGKSGSFEQLDVNTGIGTINCKKINISDTMSFNSNITFNENVIINGSVEIFEDLSVNSGKFYIDSAVGDVTVEGSMDIAGSVKIDTTLIVQNDSNLNKVNVNNDLNVNGNLTLNGTLNNQNNSGLFQDLTSQNITTTNFYVDPTNPGLVISNITYPSRPIYIGYTQTSSSVITGCLVTAGGVGIGDNLRVANEIISESGLSLVENLSVTGNLTVSGTTTINDNTLIKGTLNVQDLSTFVKKVTVQDDIDCTEDISVGGQITCSSIQTLSTIICGGDINLTGDISTGGTASFPGGIFLNSRFIQDTSASYSISNTYSGSTFTINSLTTLTSIILPNPVSTGTNFKIIIGPGYPSGTSTSKLTSGSKIFGMITNGNTTSSITTNTYYSVVFNSVKPGDIIEIYSVYLDLTTLGYYIKATSSNSNGFTLS